MLRTSSFPVLSISKHNNLNSKTKNESSSKPKNDLLHVEPENIENVQPFASSSYDQQISYLKYSSVSILDPKKKTFEFRDRKDRIIYQGAVKNGNIKHGFGKEFFQKGNQKYEGNFKHGKYDGDYCKIYYFSGGIYYFGSVKMGKKVQGVLYHKNGKIKYKGSFNDDQLHGKDCICFDENGKKEYVGGFAVGLKDGESCIDYGPNNVILFKGSYSKG